MEHCGPLGDEHLGYRTKDEVDAWKRKDPVALFERKLTEEAVLTAQDVDQFKKKITQEIDEAVQFAKNSSFPDKRYHLQY